MLVALVAAAPASGASSVDVGATQPEQIFLMGRSALLVDPPSGTPRDCGRPPRLELVSPGGDRRVLRQFEPLARRALRGGQACPLFSVTASETQVAVTAENEVSLPSPDVDEFDPSFGEIQVATPRGRPRTLVRCDNGAPTPALDGARAAFVDACGPRAGVFVRPGAARRVAGLAEVVDLEGRYLLLSRTHAPPEGGLREVLTVYDWRARRTAYRTEASPGHSGTLQRDGSIVRARSYPADGPEPGPPEPGCERSRYDLVWHSVAEPQAHLVPFRVCSSAAWLERNRIVFERQAGAVERPDGPSALRQYALTDLADAEPLALTPPREIESAFLHTLLDFSGERFAYVGRTCRGRRLVFDTVADARRRGGPVPEPSCG